MVYILGKNEKGIFGRYSCIRLFLLSFVMMLIIMLPDIIKNSGYFVYAGDYTFQEIPFLLHTSDVIFSKGIGWDWQTDLGSDFIASYSFYTLGSVVYWLFSFVKGRALIMLMPVLTAVKTGMAAVFAYLYIKRYVKTDVSAYIAAMMYAFSGYQMFNLIYNTFFDVTAFFPLLMLSFDMLVQENKKGFFAAVTALCASVNYFFFMGEVVFVIIYYVIRCLKKDFRFTVKNFLLIALESVIGVMISAFLLVPSLTSVMSGVRASSTRTGMDLIWYSDNTIVPKIIQSLFIIPDMPSNALIFQSDENPINWASISLYLPVMTIVGVAVYMKNNKGSWMNLLFAVCMIIALIPGLNSIFYAFNSSYYARWFYMPVLFMCAASAVAIDRSYDLKFGIKLQSAALAVLLLAASVPAEITTTDLDGTESSSSAEWFGLVNFMDIFFQFMGFGVIFVLLIAAYNIKYRDREATAAKLPLVMAVLITLSYGIYLDHSISKLRTYTWDKETAEFIPELDETDGFFRMEEVGSIWNMNLMWDMNSVGSFNSIVPYEDDRFYKSVTGGKRGMSSEYKDKEYEVFSLTSVKYVFNRSTDDDLNVEFNPVKLPGYSLYDKQSRYYIYKNDYFIPMGFMYDYYISEEDLDVFIDKKKFTKENEGYDYRRLIMLRAMVVGNDFASESELYKRIPDEMLEGLDTESYMSDCTDRKSMSCSSFEYDSSGFRASIDSDREGLLFFSVPSCDGWRAEVNGAETEIVSVNYGLSAVRVSEGDNNIEFFYETPGLKTGILISAAGMSVYIVYLAVLLILRKKSKK